MVASKFAVHVARAARFQKRCKHHSLAPAIAVAIESISTPDQLRFAEAAIDNMFDLQRAASAILAHPTIIQTVQVTGDPEGEAVPGGDVKIAVRNIVSSIGRAVA